MLEAWVGGGIHRGHVRVIEEHSQGLSGEELSAYEAEVLRKAVGRTARQLGRIAGRIARRYLCEPLQERFERAFAKRSVWVTPGRDGTSVLSVETGSVLVDAAWNRLHAGAKAAARDGECTVQQWMADAAMAHLLTGRQRVGSWTGCRPRSW